MLPPARPARARISLYIIDVFTFGLLFTYAFPVSKSSSLTVRLSLPLRAALEAEAEACGESLSTVVSRHLTEGLAEDQGRRRELLLEAGMAHELDDGLRELAAVGQRLLKVRAQLTLNHPDDWNPADGPPQSTLPVAFRGEGNAPTRDNPIVTRTPPVPVPDPDPES